MSYARLIRWAFARFYREFAWTYDTVAGAVSGGCWSAWGRAALPYLRGQVLELGCGTGNLQQALASQRELWAAGLDASPQMLAITRRKLAAAGKSINLTRAVAQALPFSATSFDSVVATFPTEYIIDMATLAELRRVLRPGGRVVVALAAAFSSDGLYQQLIDLLYRATLQRSPHEQPLGPPVSLLGQRLAELGFTVVERWEAVANNQVQLVIAEYSADACSDSVSPALRQAPDVRQQGTDHCFCARFFALRAKNRSTIGSNVPLCRRLKSLCHRQSKKS